jgi:hypothetical protein
MADPQNPNADKGPGKARGRSDRVDDDDNTLTDDPGVQRSRPDGVISHPEVKPHGEREAAGKH